MTDASTRDGASVDDSLASRLHGNPEGRVDIAAAHARAQVRANLFGEDEPPMRLGRYRLLRPLGSGGMGVVYAGYDDELDRTVALKVLHVHSRGSEADRDQHRLVREAQALAQIAHPNVAEVYEVGEAGEAVFIAMEYIEGRTLKQWIQQTQPPVPALIDVFVAVGQGLSAVHDSGLLHRDIKPTNILIDVSGRARLIDFGLAKVHGELASEPSSDDAPTSTSGRAHAWPSLASNLTQTGANVGTPVYMAPEQASEGHVSPASDQFSFCVALYEALYAQRPFAASSRAERRRRIVEGAAFPAEPRVPRGVRTTLRRGLAANAEDRFRSMQALLRALAPRPSRRALPVFAAAVTALGVVAVWPAGAPGRCASGPDRIATAWNAQRRDQVRARLLAANAAHGADAAERVSAQLDAYARSWFDAHRAICKGPENRVDDGMTCLSERLARLEAWVDVLIASDNAVDFRAIAGSERLLLPTAECREAVSNVPPQLRTHVEGLRAQLARASAIHEAGQYREARALAEDLTTEAQGHGHAPLTAEARILLGSTQDDLGDATSAEASLAAAFWEAAGASADEEAVRAATLLIAVISTDLERYDEAKAWQRSAEVHIHRLGDAARPRARLLDAVGELEVMVGHVEDGLQLHQEAAAIWLKHDADGSQALATNLTEQGNALVALGRFRQARDAYNRAHEIFEARLGAKHPLVATALVRRGNMAHEAGDYEEARFLFSRALETLEATVGADAPEILSALNGLAITHESMGRPDQAVEPLVRALAALEADGGQHLNRGALHENLGRILYDLDRFEDALKHQRAALELRVRVFGDAHPLASGPLTGIGECLVALERPDEAVPPLGRALEIREEGGAGPRYLARTRFALARALATSDMARAQTLIASARADAATFDPADPKLAALRQAIEAWQP